MVEDAGKRSKKGERRRRERKKKWWSENGSENAEGGKRMDEARCLSASSETAASWHEKKGSLPLPLLPGICLDCAAERGGTQDGIALMEDDSFVPAFLFAADAPLSPFFVGKYRSAKEDGR